MKRTKLLIIAVCGLVFAGAGVTILSLGAASASTPCTSDPGYCQKKVAQVPIPWQFWGVMINPDGTTTVIDRIRISPTWLNPPPGQPPGDGPVLIRRQFAVVPAGENPVPLEELVWPPGSPSPVPNLDWQPVRGDEQFIEVLAGEDVVLEIPVREEDVAVLVAYEVMAETALGREIVGHFVNEAILESKSPQTIVEIMVNFDIHNSTKFHVTNFELDFHGLHFGCEDVVQAIGFIVGTGEPWGADAANPLVVRPIPGGTEVKWIRPDRPLRYCEWLHVGLVFNCNNFDCFNPDPTDPTAFRATVQGYWTTIADRFCQPRTWGFWKRICEGVCGDKKVHPETPPGFDCTLCPALQVRGNQRSDPKVRAKAQFAALLMNVKYDFLAECCEVIGPDGTVMNVREAVERIERLLKDGKYKEAADLAEAINSGAIVIG